MQIAIFVVVAKGFPYPASFVGARFTIDYRDDRGRVAYLDAGNASYLRLCITPPDSPQTGIHAQLHDPWRRSGARNLQRRRPGGRVRRFHLRGLRLGKRDGYRPILRPGDLPYVEVSTYQGAAGKGSWQPAFSQLLLHAWATQVREAVHLDGCMHPGGHISFNPLQ